ncbi:hypothetical protein [Arthrobacter sp. ISL-48]|nr:hypothetical protein [Arthrobacter sp. ISL-48]
MTNRQAGLQEVNADHHRGRRAIRLVPGQHVLDLAGGRRGGRNVK